MKPYVKWTSVLLSMAMLAAMGGCQSKPPVESDTTDAATNAATDALTEATTEDTKMPEREIYEDLSFSIPAYTKPQAKPCTLSSDGSGSSGKTTLDFTELNGQYIVSSTKIKFSCHDVAACADCGYVTTDDGGAFLFSSEGLDQGGISVTLATPIKASTVTGMTITFKTTANAPSSSMRILPTDETNNAAFINECGSMAGAVDQWVTTNLGIKDYAKLADSDGYIRGFQMYFRNKNKTDCYVQSIQVTVSPEPMLAVDEIIGNYTYAQEAIDAIAHTIADRFTLADIRAEITVKSGTYRNNTSASDGTMRYQAIATLSDGTVIQKEHTVTIPALSGAWLDATDSPYGAKHDSRGQWQETFDPAGILFLTDNTISCAEGLKGVEYAVINRDAAYDDEATLWFKPQKASLQDGGFSHLLVNAFMDYGEGLSEGQSYRFLVRGVTERNNYVLHLDIPFVYSPLSKDATSALWAAEQALTAARLTCDGRAENKAELLQKTLSEQVGDSRIRVVIDVLGEGLQSVSFSVSLRYSAPITELRLPAYALDGEVLADVYNYSGAAFCLDRVTVPYTDEKPAISLLSPYDGERGIVLAADCIYAHAIAPLAVIQNAAYGYLNGEKCTPPPVHLDWDGEKLDGGKAYTVLLSKNRDMSDAAVYTVADSCLDVYNLNVGTQYYWQVQAGEDVSFVQTFTTADGYPRFVKLDGVSNVRDIGGYTTTDGKKVRQNLAYRSGQLDGITQDGLNVALQELGIRTDLDIRGGSSRPLGSTVQHISVPMQWYEHIFEADHHEAVRQTISTFAKEENYPILFHCSLGRDRTGTTSFLILGLLGVDEDTLRHEYFASFFSQAGSFDPEEFPLLIINMDRLTKGLDQYGGANATLQEKIHAYLLDIGVTEAEIQSIRSIWLES